MSKDQAECLAILREEFRLLAANLDRLEEERDRLSTENARLRAQLPPPGRSEDDWRRLVGASKELRQRILEGQEQNKALQEQLATESEEYCRLSDELVACHEARRTAEEEVRSLRELQEEVGKRLGIAPADPGRIEEALDLVTSSLASTIEEVCLQHLAGLDRSESDARRLREFLVNVGNRLGIVPATPDRIAEALDLVLEALEAAIDEACGQHLARVAQAEAADRLKASWAAADRELRRLREELSARSDTDLIERSAEIVAGLLGYPREEGAGGFTPLPAARASAPARGRIVGFVPPESDTDIIDLNRAVNAAASPGS